MRTAAQWIEFAEQRATPDGLITMTSDEHAEFREWCVRNRIPDFKSVGIPLGSMLWGRRIQVSDARQSPVG